MTKKLLLLIAFVSISLASFAQSGVLKGKVIDKANGETVPFAAVTLLKGGAVVAAVQTDLDGEYTIKPIPPGEYDVKATYVGYSPAQVSKVKINAEKTTYVDLNVSQGMELAAVEITDYKVPLIDPNASSISTVGKAEFNQMATKNLGAVASQTAGVFQADENKGINVRGSRGSDQGGESSTDVYIDGVRTRGSNKVPQRGVEQVSVITSGVPAQYGDATGGVISVTTSGPQSELHGGVEAISSQITDAYGYNFVGWNLTGPIYSKKDTATDTKRTVLGFFLSGEVSTEKDPDPSAVGFVKVKDDVLKDLQDHPLAALPDGEGSIKRADSLSANDFEKIKARQNVRSNNVSLAGKIDFAPTKNLNFTVGGNFDYVNKHDWVYMYSLLNFNNNSQSIDNTWRVWGRVSQKFNFGSSSAENKEKSASIISRADYSIQAEYQKSNSITQDDTHKTNFFNYGYVGKFNTYQDKIYGFDADQFGNLTMRQLGFYDTAVTFTRSDLNPQLANYTSDYFKYINDKPSTLVDVALDGGLRNGDRLNSQMLYSLWSNTGRQYNGYSKEENSQFRTFGYVSADMGKHAIKAGFEYEQRDDRYWYMNDASGLWSLIREGSGLVNRHIEGMDTSKPIFNSQLSGSLSVIDYERKYSAVGQSYFDKQLRKKLGYAEDGIDYIHVDSYDPSTYDITMFNPDELLNKGGNQIVNYRGYDPYGKKSMDNPTLLDYFNKVDADSNFLRPVGAFKPIYMAGYIMDNFDFRDLKFNVGVRIDRFDGNQQVLKDQFSLFETVRAADVKDLKRPDNIGDDFVPYVTNRDAPGADNVVGYRDPNSGYPQKWYNTDGIEVLDPSTLAFGQRIFPYLADPKNSLDPSDSKHSKNLAFKDYAPQVTVSPRIAFSFPISDMARFTAHYDVLTQRPSSNWYVDPSYYFNIMNSGGSPYLNNANLKPETTTDYELGFDQVLGEKKNSAIKLNAFYREFRNLITTNYVTMAYPIAYETPGNIDFQTVKGLTARFEFRRSGNVQFNFNYTLQFADGTGSDAGSNSNFIAAGLPNLRTPTPLDFDQRHNFVGNVDFRYDEGAAYNGPVIAGYQVFSNSGLNFTARAGSGTPYTAQSNPLSPSSILIASSGGSPIMKGSINGSRKPWTYRFDLRAEKNFKIKVGKKEDGTTKKEFNAQVYLQVLNLLNTKNVMEVYGYTGNPDDDGYITSGPGQQYVNGQTVPESFIYLYKLKVNNPRNYSLPRRTRIGLTFDF